MPVQPPGGTDALKPDVTSKRSLGEDAVPAPGHHKNDIPADVKTIPGWGIDLDFKRRNVFPMELPSDVRTARGNVKHRQVPRHSINISNEMPDLTPVFGDVIGTKGLSGLLRNYAYEYGEGTSRHWMTLMLADRIDRIESMFTDAARGKPDNIVAEKAWKAKFKYGDDRNRTKNIAVVGAAFLGAVVLGALVTRKLRE